LRAAGLTDECLAYPNVARTATCGMVRPRCLPHSMSPRGFVIGKCYKRHRAAEFLKFLKEIDARVPKGLDIHIVMDN
jgi:hypothetical protein